MTTKEKHCWDAIETTDKIIQVSWLDKENGEKVRKAASDLQDWIWEKVMPMNE